MQKLDQGKPIVWPPSPTPEDEARQKVDDEAWASLEVELREAKQTCARDIEVIIDNFNTVLQMATATKKKAIDEAYIHRQERQDRANMKFREKTLPPLPQTTREPPIGPDGNESHP